MVIHTFGHHRTYEAEALLKLFRPAEKFMFSEEPEPPADEEYLSAVLLSEADGKVRLVCRTCMHGETHCGKKTLPGS